MTGRDTAQTHYSLQVWQDWLKTGIGHHFLQAGHKFLEAENLKHPDISEGGLSREYSL